MRSTRSKTPSGTLPGGAPPSPAEQVLLRGETPRINDATMPQDVPSTSPRPPLTRLLSERLDGAKKHRAFLEVRSDASNEQSVVGLFPGRHVVGRNPDLQINLPHHSVSRIHAEFVSDPSERWWIHDLGSTNGTYVNGSPILQRLLSAGDTIVVGEYTLRYRVPSEEGKDNNRTMPPPTYGHDVTPATMRFRAVNEADLSGLRLSAASEFGREVIQIEDKRARLTRLCEYMVGDTLSGLCACVARLRKGAKPNIHTGPHNRPLVMSEGSRRTRAEFEDLVEVDQELFFQNAGLTQALTTKVGAAGSILILGSVIDATEDGYDVMFVELPSFCSISEWSPLLSLFAESYRQANIVWEMRHHARLTAMVDRELEMARQIQESLVPRVAHIEGLDLSIGFEPCQWVGGDYVDAVRMADGRVLLIMADVCGKGLQASLIASSLHTFVHALSDASHGLPELVERMNKYLCHYLPEHSFVTAVCIAYHPRSGQLECVNAGHPPPILVSSAGAVRFLQSGDNVALGMMAGMRPVAARYDMAFGDVLLLYTDGVTEAEDSSRAPLGSSRVASEFGSIVADLPDAPADTMQRRLAQTITMHRGSSMAADDTTLLIARRSRPELSAVKNSPESRTSRPPPKSS